MQPEEAASMVGLCESCKHSSIIRSERERSFYLCLRFKTDLRFPKYPRLPVVTCPGFERRELAEDPHAPA